VNNSARTARVAVSADGRGLVSRAGAVLLWETMRVTGHPGRPAPKITHQTQAHASTSTARNIEAKLNARHES